MKRLSFLTALIGLPGIARQTPERHGPTPTTYINGVCPVCSVKFTRANGSVVVLPVGDSEMVECHTATTYLSSTESGYDGTDQHRTEKYACAAIHADGARHGSLCRQLGLTFRRYPGSGFGGRSGVDKGNRSFTRVRPMGRWIPYTAVGQGRDDPGRAILPSRAPPGRIAVVVGLRGECAKGNLRHESTVVSDICQWERARLFRKACDGLDEMERAVLQYVAQGLSRSQMAVALHTTEWNVRRIRTAAEDKVRCSLELWGIWPRRRRKGKANEQPR
jgi:DNA-binding CsgD family transcriptional regulator